MKKFVPEDDKIRTSRIISESMQNIKGMEDKIRNTDDVINCRDIAVSAEEIVDKCSDRLSEEEKEYYKNLSKKYANIVKDYYLLPLDEKPKNMMMRLSKRLVNQSIVNYEKLVLDHFNAVRDCFDVLARSGDFDSYIIAMEWDREPSKRFYLPRRDVLIRHNIIQDIQDLIDKKIRMLIDEAPPGIGKSVLGEFFCCFTAGLNNNCRGLIGNANATLTQGFYNDIVNFMTSPEYRQRKIFKSTKPLITNAENNALYFEKKTREPNILCRSIEVGATGLIHLNSEGFLYMDDVVKTSEQANNRDFLQKLNYMFTSTFYDRRENDDVPVLIIGTPWSLYDLIGFLKSKFGKESWFRVNSTPAYYVNENGDKITNFDYKGKQFKSVEYWENQISIDDPVIAKAKFLMQPIEREGRPFEDLCYFNMEELQERIEKGETPYKCSATDVAVKKGGDYYACGITYVFEKTKDVYLVDAIYSNAGTDYTIPKTINMFFEHKIEKAEFEEKEGTVTGKITYGISDMVKRGLEKLGHRCLIGCHSGAGLKSKSVRIDTYANEIKGIQTLDGYKLKILSEKDRKRNIEYNLAVEHLKNYSQSEKMQGKQIDDFPDMLAMDFAYNINSKKNNIINLFNIKYR